ncbi:MAG TPA: cobaltochelatase subunit CobN [Pyrinomonadaceae bacterium]|nr:cobaltochelatase subunit CobN [Pyrinomonadaceae bacterium]
MNVTVLYVGSSLLAPLRQAEAEINRAYSLELRICAYNFGLALTDGEWQEVERDLACAEVVFVIHVMDGENAVRLLSVLERYERHHRAVVVINCMPDLMRRTRMGQLDFGQLFRPSKAEAKENLEGDSATSQTAAKKSGRASRLIEKVGSWMGDQARAGRANKSRSHTQYLRLVDHLPGLLRFVPSAGKLRDIKHYLYLFCYFLQPTPANIRSMVLYAIKHYVPVDRVAKADIHVPQPETMPSVAIYHPDAPALFESFEAYHKWSERRAGRRNARVLVPEETIGLLLMRPQIVSNTRLHYDGLIRAIEAEGLSVVPAISTLMDNREACEKFFIEKNGKSGKREKRGAAKDDGPSNERQRKARVSQIVSLTGFSFVGGPAMNDSAAAAAYLLDLNRPFRAAVSLDVQTVEAWEASGTGLNPVQAGMQIAIPELDGATEPFVYGGMPAGGTAPLPLKDRCRRIARRLRRWNYLRNASRSELRVALLAFCFPPNKGNIGTAADLDVFPSVWEMLHRLRADGYTVDVPHSPDELREMLLGGNSEEYAATANVVYRMTTDEYRRLCPYVQEIEKEWGRAPGRINSFGDELIIQGVMLGNVFLGVQPTFGYEGDPMRLLMARSGAPHHGFMALYTYLEKVFLADAVIHVGTHGALEFMPGKQVGLSEECWPDRLIGELPHVYVYSVNNPSEGSIAKRRSYAELISYLTPPIENAGLYKELASLKELMTAYRQATDEREREHLFTTIEELARAANFKLEADTSSTHV